MSRFVWTWAGATIGALAVLVALRWYSLRIYGRAGGSTEPDELG